MQRTPSQEPSGELDPDACYRALAAHDERFDGVFFVGVRTTGIYCRPVCRARTPRRDRCVFFRRAVHAEKEGFRACFRCRPERAPGSSSVDAVSRLVDEALRRIDEGALNDESVEALASSLGVTGRHLRRVMQDELGVGPAELAQSRRIALARELLLSTSLSITEIAFASGFASVRRFNAAYRASQRMTPSEVRRPTSKTSRKEASSLRIAIDVRPPFDVESAFAFLHARAVSGMESFAGDTYVRGAWLGGKTGLVAITPARDHAGLIIEVSPSLASSLMAVSTRVRRMFDADTDPTQISAHLSRDPLLALRVAKRPALRVMGAFDPFEWATRAILGQQVSVRAGLTLAARLVEMLGEPIRGELSLDAPDLPTHAWPTAERIASSSEQKLCRIGLTGARARTLRALATAVASGSLVLGRVTRSATDVDVESIRRSLLAIPGIGPWTAEYIMMRSLSWPDAFPSGDLGLRRALGDVTAAACEARARHFRPWRAYAAAHLWMGLSEMTGGQPVRTKA